MITNETIHSLASSRNRTGDDAIDNVGEYVKEWWRVDYKKIMDSLFKENFELEQQRDQYKAENEKLKEEVEYLNGIIKDEEDWKLLELEERWE